MSFSPFEYRLGLDQGRVQPDTRTVSTDDLPTAAVLTTLVGESFPLEDGELLLIAVNGGATQQVAFNAVDFTDITGATAAEVAAVIGTALSGVTAIDNGSGKVQLTTDAVGLSASFKVSGGKAQNALQFPTALETGTQGKWSFILGHESTGETFTFADGDQIKIAQTANVNDATRLEVRGHIDWRGSAATETGYTWRLRLGPIDSYSEDILDHTVIDDGVRAFSLDDLAMNLEGLAGDPNELAFTLTLTDTGGGAGEIVAEMPAVFLDILTFTEPSDVLLGNRDPHPGQANIPLTYATLDFLIMSHGGQSIDLANTRIIVDGNIVYDASSQVSPYTVTTTGSKGPAGNDTLVQVTLTGAGWDFFSGKTINVEVDTRRTAGSNVNTTWSYTIADTVAPTLQAVQGRDKFTVRAVFSEPMLMDTTAGGALLAASYSLTPITVPAVSVTIDVVTRVDSFTVDLTTDIEMSFGATYRLDVISVQDVSGNVLDAAVRSKTFLAFRPTQPAGRSFDLWEFQSPYDRRQDEEVPGTPLRQFTFILQDVADVMLCDIDRWTEIIDIDVAPEQFLDAILCGLGNPFGFVDINTNTKRRLARILVDIYKEKGTEVGIINAIRFFLGVDVELDIINDNNYWQIGQDLLNATTVIGPSDDSPLWYSFTIVSPIVLTDQQRADMLRVADYMKVAHEHILGITEPGSS